MKRNIAFILISILLVTLVLISAGCKTAEQSSPSASAETTVPSTTEDDGIFDEDDLLALLDEAGTILATEDTLVMLHTSVYVRWFININREILQGFYIWEDDTITLTCVKEDSDRREIMKYGVFLYLLTERYPDCVCDFDYRYTSMSNLPKDPIMFFFPNYKEQGYDTVLDCLKAIDSGDIDRQDNSFYILVDDTFWILEYGPTHNRYGITRYDYDLGDYAKD